MKEYNFIYQDTEGLTVSAKNPNDAFKKAVEELKEQLESNCYSGDLQEID